MDDAALTDSDNASVVTAPAVACMNIRLSIDLPPKLIRSIDYFDAKLTVADRAFSR